MLLKNIDICQKECISSCFVAYICHNRTMAIRETTVRARVPISLKEETDAVFDQLGLSSSEAIRLFLTQVRHRRGLPFSVVLPQQSDNSDLLLTAKQRQAAIDSIYED